MEKYGNFIHYYVRVNWCHHYGNQYVGSSKELKIEIKHDPEMLLTPGIYLKGPKSTCILLIFNHPYLLIQYSPELRSGNSLESSTDEENVVQTYNGILPSVK